MSDFLWDARRQEQDMWFREACDAAAEPGARPVSRGVLRGLAEAEEARAVWCRVAGLSGAASPIVFFERLVEDARWKALVSECVDADRRRSRERSDVTRTQRNRLRAFLTRLAVLGR
jgi:hypothetical protein